MTTMKMRMTGKMNKKIVLFGTDNSGKTTLGKALAKELGGTYFPSLGPAPLEAQVRFLNENLNRPGVLIFDRFPIIEENVCGTVFRDKDNFEHVPCDQYLNSIDLFVFCNPGIESILNWGEREQMSGVKENISILYGGYSEWFKRLKEAGMNVVEYNWRIPEDYSKIFKGSVEMNITHAVSENIVGDKLEAIFNRQKELMGKYHDIEKRSGLLQTEDCPVNLDDKRGQARLKDFAWRITEEVGEALDALLGDDDMEHFNEELVDGLHFLTELTILAGFEAKEVASLVVKSKRPTEDSLDVICKHVCSKEYNLPWDVTILIRNLGMLCNTLKNKPWKQSHMKTDKEAFKEKLGEVWGEYIHILVSSLGTAEEIADVYLKKSQVNKFRQRSNY